MEKSEAKESEIIKTRSHFKKELDVFNRKIPVVRRLDNILSNLDLIPLPLLS